MKKVYLDNAATTAPRPEVITEITTILTEQFGNPSSSHSFGRSARTIVETSRKKIAALLNAESREILFTSGGTEADNWIISNAVKNLGVKRIITSRTEHHAVLHTVEALSQETKVIIEYVKVLSDGSPDTNHLEALLADNLLTLVSLMHINNETGVITDIEKIGTICHTYNALFHSDTVQSIGKETLNLSGLPIDFAVASAHKFHGPKGIGFAYIQKNSGLKALLLGGEQEKGMRAGTEAVHQIAGMAKALELSYKNLNSERKHIIALKEYLLQELKIVFPDCKLNGILDNSKNDTSTFYTIANVMLPLPADKTAMLLFNLDMQGIAVSRGSACQSGSIKPSHVLQEILNREDQLKPSVRISFSHTNTREDVDLLINALKNL